MANDFAQRESILADELYYTNGSYHHQSVWGITHVTFVHIE